MPTLEHTSPLPLYHQLKTILRNQIQSGQFVPHSAIPSEPELVASFRVSRATVRQALTDLVNEGFLYRQHGKGTFVQERRERKLAALPDLATELGQGARVTLVQKTIQRGDDTTRAALRLHEAEQTLRLELLYTANDAPAAFEVNVLPYPRAIAVYQRAHELTEEERPLLRLLLSEGIRPAQAEVVISAEPLAEQAATILQKPANFPALRVRTTFFDMTGFPVMITEAVRTFQWHISLPVELGV